MKWINKSNGKYRKRGRRIVENFLDRAWSEQESSYINCNYKSLKDEHRIDRLLLEQQHYHCCYCMRLVDFKQHTTLEHIIPHKLKCEEMRTKVSREDPPYPHFCAYENLVVSCDGSIPDPEYPNIILPGKLHLCCNNVRGNDKILPLFFIRRISKDIIYKPNGEIDYRKGKYEKKEKYEKRRTKYKETIEALKLEHGTLKLMRRAWAGIVVGNRFTIDDIRNAGKDKQLREDILLESPIPVEDSKTLKSDLYWNTFFSYNWFYSYFKKPKK
ncbi:MAG: hypothetical protein LBN06_07775 [Prevotellaceae bacterium]|jgi:hypothetical protein|nr:hypothetical protein [Prevotellaceae bacterium]